MPFLLVFLKGSVSEWYLTQICEMCPYDSPSTKDLSLLDRAADGGKYQILADKANGE